MTLSLVAGIVTLLGAAVTLVALVVLHVLPTGVRPWRDPVSQYGITRFRAGYRVAAWGATVAAVGAIGVFYDIGAAGATWTIVLLAVFAVARLVIPFAPMDEPGSPVTAGGRRHNLLAILAFAAVTAAAFLAAGVLHDGGYDAASTWSTVFAVVMAIGSVGVIVAARARLSFFGAAERLIYAGFLGWFAVVGVLGVLG